MVEMDQMNYPHIQSLSLLVQIFGKQYFFSFSVAFWIRMTTFKSREAVWNYVRKIYWKQEEYWKQKNMDV